MIRVFPITVPIMYYGTGPVDCTVYSAVTDTGFRGGGGGGAFTPRGGGGGMVWLRP